MEAAWRDFVSWAVKQDFLIAAFEAETGRKMLPPAVARSGLDAMIDEACGYDPAVDYRDVLTEFTIWVSIWEWGESESPSLLQAEIKRRRELPGAPAWLFVAADTKPEPRD
jgi:hypothetical protein